MTDYPEDILRAAEELADDVICLSDPYRSELVGLFAAALAAERERCAKIAEDAAERDLMPPEAYSALAYVAAAIRGEKP
jgi:hypothetical protein